MILNGVGIKWSILFLSWLYLLYLSALECFKIGCCGVRNDPFCEGDETVKCRDCKYSGTIYDRSVCAWRAFCDALGTAQIVSEFTEDEDADAPKWDVDLGQSNPYCQNHQSQQTR